MSQLPSDVLQIIALKLSLRDAFAMDSTCRGGLFEPATWMEHVDRYGRSTMNVCKLSALLESETMGTREIKAFLKKARCAMDAHWTQLEYLKQALEHLMHNDRISLRRLIRDHPELLVTGNTSKCVSDFLYVQYEWQLRAGAFRNVVTQYGLLLWDVRGFEQHQYVTTNTCATPSMSINLVDFMHLLKTDPNRPSTITNSVLDLLVPCSARFEHTLLNGRSGYL